MVIETFYGVDLMGQARDEMGKPWKDDLLWKKDAFGFEEREEVRVVFMVAIEMGCSWCVLYI